MNFIQQFFYIKETDDVTSLLGWAMFLGFWLWLWIYQKLRKTP